MAFNSDDKTSIRAHYPDNILEGNNANRCIYLLIKSIDFFSSDVEAQRQEIERENVSINAETTNSNGDSVDRAKLLKAKTIYGVALHLPNELNENQNHEWEQSNSFVSNTIGGIADIKLGDVSINKIAGELSSRMGFRKPMINPGYFQDYRGTSPREFSFTWEFVPNNEVEANNIRIIINNLKKFTLPTTTLSGVGMLSPYIFDIIIGNQQINEMINMNNVVCRNMSINYSSDNSLQFFTDGTPKHMTLSMTFAERSTVTSNYYKQL